MNNNNNKSTVGKSYTLNADLSTTISNADTTWVLISACLVFLMV